MSHQRWGFLIWATHSFVPKRPTKVDTSELTKTMGKNKGRKSKQPDYRIVDEVNDSEDEEIDEDEAFNSDDERKYGAFFENQENTDNSEDDEDIASDESVDDHGDNDEDSESDEDSNEGDGGQYMLDLLDRLDDDKKKPAPEEKKGRLANHVKESPYAASVVPAANLTLDSLMGELKDTKGFGQVAKSLHKVATGKATPAPLAKVRMDRIERKLHYEEQSREMNQWIDAVQDNRKAEFLDFRPQERVEVTRDVMIGSFVPSTDFEQQLQAALEQAGQQDEETMLKAEEKAITDDLGNNLITLEEYEKRRGQLAKMRSLMLSYEQKRHHMKKIKSKKYRRIRKRQRERAKESELADAVEGNPDMARELEEKEEVDRMKERMTLAHRNTSKWAKHVLKRGKNVDKDTQRALSAQLKKGDDLLQRMKSRMNKNEDSDDDEDLAETARKVLEDTQDEEIPTSGLFKLAFMQKGVDKQRQRAKEEARQLLEELERGESESEDEASNQPKMDSKKVKVASAAEMKKVMKKGDMVPSAPTFGNSTSLTVSGSLSLDNDSAVPTTFDSTPREHGTAIVKDMPKVKHSTPSEKPKKASPREESKSASKRVQHNGEKHEEPEEKKNRPDKSIAQSGKATGKDRIEEEENPWLVAVEASSGTPKKKVQAEPKTVVDVERAAEILDTSSRTVPNQEKVPTRNDMDDSKKQIVELTQEELVRRAFAGINNQEEFAEEKKRIEDEEDGVLEAARKKGPDPSTVSGWGSWTGLGAPLPPPAGKRKLPKHLQAPTKKSTKRQRTDERKPAVILREGRISKTANAHMIQQVPHPFSSREEYERSMIGGLGREWNLSTRVMVRPDVVTARGKIIQPLSMQAKRKKTNRPAAKF